MKVTHVFWSLTFGGIETMLVNIANEQVKLGHDVSVVLINELYEQTLVDRLDKRVRFLCMGRRRNSRSPMFLYKLNKTLLEMKPDAIHLHGSGLYGFLLCEKLRRVACSTLHALPQGAVRRGGLPGCVFLWSALKPGGNVSLIDVVPRVFSISQAVHDDLLFSYGVESTILNNGIVTHNFKRREPVLPKGGFRIVQVSRLEHDKKGQDLLLQAVAQMQDKTIRVDFVGEGASMEYLKSMARDLNITDRVRFLGKQTQDYIAEHLRDYDLFVQPSRFEGFGLTVAEAMAAGVPVLVSSGQGPAEVCCNDAYGWVFRNGSVEHLAQCITKIQNNYAEALRKAESAWQYVRDTYDVSITASKYLENYE